MSYSICTFVGQDAEDVSVSLVVENKASSYMGVRTRPGALAVAFWTM